MPPVFCGYPSLPMAGGPAGRHLPARRNIHIKKRNGLPEQAVSSYIRFAEQQSSGWELCHAAEKSAGIFPAAFPPHQ